MSAAARRAAADRMMAEIYAYLGEQLAPGLSALDETWELINEPAADMLAALAGWEEGRVSYAELEAAGTRFVEAWEVLNDTV